MIKNTIRLLKDPLSVITGNRSEFAVWFIFTIFFGQIGILANMIIRSYSTSTSMTESIFIDSSNGTFYTFSIALVASMLGPLFINLLNSPKLSFKTLKIFMIIISIVFLFFSGIVYSAVQKNHNESITDIILKIDWTQLVVYVASLGLVFYGYCILRLENDPDKYKYINDPVFSETDDKEVKDRIEEVQNVNDDGEGVKL